MHGRYTESNHLFPGFEYFTDLKVLSLTEVDIAMGWKPNTAEIGLFWMRLSCLRISRYLIQTMCLEQEGEKKLVCPCSGGLFSFSNHPSVLKLWTSAPFSTTYTFQIFRRFQQNPFPVPLDNLCDFFCPLLTRPNCLNVPGAKLISPLA